MNAWEIKREAQIPMWQERIRACRSSGMTVLDWCRENGITKQTYYAWEKLCLQRACESGGNETKTLIKIAPDELPVKGIEQKVSVSSAPAELVIHCGCVSMDISPQMPVARIAELVSALNHHV